MRMYAWLKEPQTHYGNIPVFKVMLYENEGKVYLFEYSSPEAIQCSSDLCYDSMEELHGDWDDLIDERGWIKMDEPLPYCQHDAFIPLRVKGRDIGEPEWGKFETLKDGNWVPYKPV